MPQFDVLTNLFISGGVCIVSAILQIVFRLQRETWKIVFPVCSLILTLAGNCLYIYFIQKCLSAWQYQSKQGTESRLINSAFTHSRWCCWVLHPSLVCCYSDMKKRKSDSDTVLYSMDWTNHSYIKLTFVSFYLFTRSFVLTHLCMSEIKPRKLMKQKVSFPLPPTVALFPPLVFNTLHCVVCVFRFLLNWGISLIISQGSSFTFFPLLLHIQFCKAATLIMTTVSNKWCTDLQTAATVKTDKFSFEHSNIKICYM